MNNIDLGQSFEKFKRESQITVNGVRVYTIDGKKFSAIGKEGTFPEVAKYIRDCFAALEESVERGNKLLEQRNKSQ